MAVCSRGPLSGAAPAWSAVAATPRAPGGAPAPGPAAAPQHRPPQAPAPRRAARPAHGTHAAAAAATSLLTPCCSIFRCASGIGGSGSRSIPWAARLRWSTRAAMLAARSASLVRSAQRCAHVHVLLAVIGQLALAPLARLHVKTGLGPQARRGDLTRRRQQVRVEIARVALRARRVHREVHGDAVTLGQLAREAARQASRARARRAPAGSVTWNSRATREL